MKAQSYFSQISRKGSNLEVYCQPKLDFSPYFILFTTDCSNKPNLGEFDLIIVGIYCFLSIDLKVFFVLKQIKYRALVFLSIDECLLSSKTLD